jgi:pimeloyl-ACP methyl ester carboxylesterase
MPPAEASGRRETREADLAARRAGTGGKTTKASAKKASAADVGTIGSDRQRSPSGLTDQEVENLLRTGDEPALMEDLFGPEGYTELRDLARRAAARSVRGGERVLILPGIMGSRLGTRVLGPIWNVIWLDPVSIGLGRLVDLTLAANGSPGSIVPLGVLSFAYMALKLRLRAAGYDADFAPFDWRRDIRDLGAELAKLIEGTGVPTHLVAHSMGGLVARAALAHSPPNLGRVVTLGTPNFGSYSPVQAFRGVHSVVSKLDFIDRFHDQSELAAIFGTFPGLIQMMPSRQLRPESFFSPETWPSSGSRPSDAMLAAAAKVQGSLPMPDDRWHLIVGVDNETVVNARREGAGASEDFVYETSLNGDGTVPVDLALVQGRPTWVTTAAHGSMPNSATVAEAVDSILATGQTGKLPTYQASLGGARARTAIRRTFTDRDVARAAAMSGQPGRALSSRERRLLVAELAAPPGVGGGRPTTPALAAEAEAAMSIGPVMRPGEAGPLLTDFVVRRSAVRRIEFDLVLGSITEVRADAYVAGIFRNVQPRGAFEALDQELGGALRQIVARKMVAGEAGEVTTFPTGRHRLGAGNVVLAGLGSFERFTDDVLELVGENVTRTALLTRLDDFAIVPVGAASGSTTAGALRALLRGFLRALSSTRDARLRGICLCEIDESRFNELRVATMGLIREGLFGDIEVVLNERRLPEAQPTRQSSPSLGAEPLYLITRLDLEDDGKASVVASVLTPGGKAAIVQGRAELDVAKLETITRALRNDGLPAIRAESLGKEIAELALPPDIFELLDRELSAEGVSPPLVVVHDSAMSRVPWEVLNVGNKAPARLGGLTHRYDGGGLSVAKWSEKRVSSRDLRVLLVVNPTQDLDGAASEGARIESLLGGRRDIKLHTLRGPQARRSELLTCFQSGEFDVVHYAGHAFFDPDQRAGSGILCYGREVLSGADLASLRQLPSLMFFNACESARVRRPGVQETASDEPVRPTIGFAESFLAGGVANYLGTYWPVGDAAAETFSTIFYDSLLKEETLGTAVLKGRRAVFDAGSGDWANYVLYGIPGFKLISA